MENLAIKKTKCKVCKEDKILADFGTSRKTVCKKCYNAEQKVVRRKMHGCKEGISWKDLGNKF